MFFSVGINWWSWGAPDGPAPGTDGGMCGDHLDMYGLFLAASLGINYALN
jgi:hypothetical protein